MVLEEATIFQPATEAATRCPRWGKSPTVTHCQHRAWRARTRTKAPSLPTRTTPCQPGWASPPHEQQEVVVTLTKEQLGIMSTMVLTIPPIRPIFNRREDTSNPLTTGR